MKEAKAVEKREREWGSGRIFKMGFKKEPQDGTAEHAVWKKRVWWVQFNDASGRQRRESSRSTTCRVAEKLLGQRLGERDAGLLPTARAVRLTYEDLRRAYYAEYVERERRSLRYDKAGKPRLDAVVRLDGFFAGYRVLAITSDAVHDFVAKLKAEGLANQTVQHSLNALKHMFKIAVREKKLSAAAVPYVPSMDLSEGVRKGFLKHDEFLRLRSELPEYLRCPLTLAYQFGVRRGEIFGLRWSDVDLRAAQIRLEKTKNGEKRTVPAGKELLAMLEMEREKYPEAEFVFMRTDRKDKVRRTLSFAKAWASACARAGVSGTLFHDLRRCGVRNMIRSGVPRVVAMRISGHKTESTFRRYDIVDGEDLKRAASQTDDYLAKLDAEAKQDAEKRAKIRAIADSDKPEAKSIN
jgi:integrase